MAEITPDPVIAEAIEKAKDRRRMSAGIDMMSKRASDFGSELEMQLTGMAMVPEARAMLNDALTEKFRKRTFDSLNSSRTFSISELVIGDGPAAAVYCAQRVLAGKPKPIVVTRNAPEYVGGTFAMAGGPSFRLNSGRRPGKLGSPKDGGSALNYLPGGLIQESNLPGGDFGTDADMALVIRLMLAQFADLVPSCTATAGTAGPDRVQFTEFDYRQGFEFRRILDARGLGGETATGNGSNVLTFNQLRRKMATEDFPLQGMRRVAIIGDGKSALCAAESVLGIMPTRGPIMDWVEKADIYAPNLPVRYKDWRKEVRTRYLALSRQVGKRLNVIPRRGEALPYGDSVLIDGTSYDMAVLCTGQRREQFNPEWLTSPFRGVARKVDGVEAYLIGVAAQLPFTTAEFDQGIAEEPENVVALFRNMPRVAALANILD